MFQEYEIIKERFSWMNEQIKSVPVILTRKLNFEYLYINHILINFI